MHVSVAIKLVISCLVAAGLILNAVSLSILAEMSSCPLAFVMSSVESRLYTSSSAQLEKVGRIAVRRGMWKITQR